MYQDDCRLKGVVNLVLRDKDGKVKQHKTIRNKVTRAGIAHIIGRMIDDGQDKYGEHKMPRMMSHMAIGIGASARNAPNSYTATDFDALPTNAYGQSDTGSSATLSASRKKAASPAIFDKMLQDERGFRVQLMKDTTLATDYQTLTLELAQDGSSAFHSLTSDNLKSILTFTTGSQTGGVSSLQQLRTKLKLNKIGTTLTNGVVTGSDVDVSGSNIKIEKIESAVSPASSGGSTVTFDKPIPTASRPTGSGPVYIEVEYVEAITLTTYSTHTAMPNHPTLTHEKSVFEPKGVTANALGPFGAANSRIGGGVNVPITVATERDTTTTVEGPYTELGLGMLGITRGQIGAFYERHLEYNIKLIHTNSDGLPDTTAQANQNPVDTTLSEPSYAVLDGTANSGSNQSNRRARFPFIGAAEDKPSGVAQTGTIGAFDSANHNAITGTGATRGTEFVQFGTAVDGIFQGELVGASIAEDIRGALPEGYPANEVDYATVGGLTVDNGEGAEKLAVYDTTNGNAFISYDFTGASYTPNAVAGTKKNGDRIVYVATFKENNPRPELDYDQVHATSTGVIRAPKNRVYPITEAGIFNKHKKDLGIFDVANRSYTSNDGSNTDLAHIDTRLNEPKPTTGTTIQLSSGTTADDTEHPEIEGVLAIGGKSITASAHGFTQAGLTQTMLCRTTFDPVNKATADTLQITWSVQLQDNTN